MTSPRGYDRRNKNSNLSDKTKPILLDSLLQESTTGLCMNVVFQNFGCRRRISEYSENDDISNKKK